MKTQRRDDAATKAFYRSERFFQHEGLWFFTTREGTTEGPFIDRIQAVLRLDAYIKVQISGMLGDEGYKVSN